MGAFLQGAPEICGSCSESDSWVAQLLGTLAPGGEIFLPEISSKSISAPPLPTLVSHTCRERSSIVLAGTQLSVSPDG